MDNNNNDLQSSSADDCSGVPAHVLPRQDSYEHGGRPGFRIAAVDEDGTAAASAASWEEAQHHDEHDLTRHANVNDDEDDGGVVVARTSRRRQRHTDPSPSYRRPPEATKSHDDEAYSHRARVAVAVTAASFVLLLLLLACHCPSQNAATFHQPLRIAFSFVKGGTPREPSTSRRLDADTSRSRFRFLQSPVASPTDSPTVSPAPTISPEPTVSPTMEPTADPDASTSDPVPSPTTDAPVLTSPVQTPAPVSVAQPVTVPTPAPVAPVAPPPTDFPTIVVYTDSPTDEPVAGTFPPSTDRPSSSFISTSNPTPAPVRSTLLPTSASTTTGSNPTAPPTTWETQAIATYNPSPYPTPGSETVPVPLSPSLDTAAPVELTPAPVANIPWTPPPVNPPDPTPAPVDHIPWTPPPNNVPAPTQPPEEGDTSEPTSEPTLESPTTDDSGPEGTAAPEAPTPRPVAPSAPSDPAPTPRPATRPTRRPSRPVTDPAEPTERPQQPPQDDGDGGGVRPSPTNDPPSANLAQKPSRAPSSTSSPTRKDENSETAPVTAPTAALGYSYDMVRVGREGLEMSIALSQSSQRRLGSSPTVRWGFFQGWGAAPNQRSLQQGGIQDAALCTEVWAKYMEDIIRYSVSQAVRSVELVDVEIQNVALDRMLDEAALMFFFDVQIRIRSPPTEHDVDKYVSAPFDTDQEKQSFVDYLRNSDCKEFKYATSVELILPPSSNSVESTSSRPANTGLVVGIAAAAVAFAMLVGLFAYMKIKARRSYRYQEEEKVLAMLQEQPTHDYASEIGMRTSADISTLSDPVPLGAVAPASRDGSTAGSFTLDYDFQKACQASVSEMSGGSHHETASRDYFSTDDGSLEAQYVADEQVEVVAPAGVLGLILETNEDGIPVVNNVKASSVLTGHVLVGDRLLSVDGQDVTVMLASDVSKLIAFKKHKPERRLVFARSSRGRNHSNSKEVLLNEMDVNQDQASWVQGSARSR